MRQQLVETLAFGTHAQQVFSSWFVCVSVCRRLFWHKLRGGLLAIPAASKERKPENKKGDFPETTVFERYAVKTSEKANLHDHTGLTQTGSACSVYLEGTRSHNEWRVSTPACYLLLQLARVRLSVRYQRETTSTNSPAHQLAVSRMRSSPRVCTVVLFILNSYEELCLTKQI